MTDNRTNELREKLTERGARYERSEDDTTIYYDGDGNRYTYNVNPDSGWAQLFGYNLTPQQAIAATLGGNENRISERLRGIAADMRNIGASSMTPRELFAYWAGEVDKAADLADFMCGVNPDGLPYGLTISDNGNLLNWRGENYVRQSAAGGEVNGETSDGYHTFNELYHHRALLFSVVVAANSNRAWKSKSHHDGTMYDGMFIVGVDTPQGQATYHYDVEPYWDMFWCKELERAPEWDGHTPDDAIERICSLRDVAFKGPKGRR